MNLYKEVTPLSRDLHKEYRLRSSSDRSFSKTSQWMPLSGVEFAQAARHYPILFIQEEKSYHPVLVLSLLPDTNSFVKEQGEWEANTYVPAFVRRYPFVLAHNPSTDQQFTVCIDPSCTLWNKTRGEALFTKEGQNTPFLDHMMNFLESYRIEMIRTAKFTEKLAGLNLLLNQNLTITGTKGTTFNLNDVFIIDQSKLANLPAKDIHELNREGMLPWVFSIIASLANLPDILDRQTNKIKQKNTKEN